ncbi:MAG TPA: polysaccharide deacetylase family sporulation protein PdaB [Tissierellales bacterium]|nr:polysaccharide deacetylase family sporulation protein PdaB [Tissierellales bacterium]
MGKIKSQSHIIFRIFIVIGLLVMSIIYTSFRNHIDIVEVFSQGKELPIYSVDRDDKKVAISFDAAWGTDYTNDILEVLDKYEVKSTFFLVGFWAEKHEDLVKEIHDKGHEVGNHSTNHPYMTKLSEEQMAKELNETGDLIKEITGEEPILFRPPFGDYNDKVIKTCEENNYYVIQWDVDSLDWKELGAQSVIDRVTRNVQEGSIVLFHNNAKYIDEYLPVVIERLQSEGYEIVPVSELIHKDDYHMDHTGRQIKGKKDD